MELRRANTGEGYLICAVDQHIIFPFTDYWKGETKNYCDKCRPEGAVLNLTIEESVSVISETT